MPEFVLENEGYKATFSTKGAELVSFIKKNKNVNKNKEYIWQADPDVWARHAPILFPVVGKSKCAAGETPMGQHGFARDMEFRLLFASEDSLMFQLTDNDDTMALYPYKFNLMVSYKLVGNTLKVTWQVINPGEEDLPFSIGGHPAFIGKGTSLKNAALQFNFTEEELEKRAAEESATDASAADASEADASAADKSVANTLTYGLLDGGLLTDDTHTLELNDRNQVRLNGTFFDKDALIVEHHQCHSVTLLEDWQPLVRVDFDSPVFGLWSAAEKDVPFVCIEPWYGRTDRVAYEGSFADREWANVLAPNSLFEAGWSMTFGK